MERFERDGPAALQVLRAAGPVTVEYFVAGTIPLAEAVRIGVMEATVHLVDVQRAVGATPAVPDAALALTRDLLVAMPPGPRSCVDYRTRSSRTTTAMTSAMKAMVRVSTRVPPEWLYRHSMCPPPPAGKRQPAPSGGGPVIIHGVPKRSFTIPKRVEKKASAIGISMSPPSARAANTRSASAVSGAP